MQLDDAFEIKAENCKVGTESFTGNGRMDILITDGKYAICIENKIYAGDQYGQLNKYAEYLEKVYKDHKIYYLTLDGHEASDDSAKGVEYTSISHSIDIVNWLEECIKIAAEKPMLRETLCQYRNHIKNLTGTNMEKKYMDELIKLISSSSENYSSATQIAEIFDKAQETIINEKLKSFLEELREFIQKKLSDSEIILESNISKQRYTGFWYCNPSWSFRIRFEFQAPNYRGFIYGITGDASFTLPENCPVKYTKPINIAYKIGEKLLFKNDELLTTCKDILNGMLSVLKKS